ncbi:MAG: DUF11 domain-containing protein [Phycisphaerales bacterium]|nr:DUF11 domain-containing protein [Phycisphaerales bacterium]
MSGPSDVAKSPVEGGILDLNRRIGVALAALLFAAVPLRASQVGDTAELQTFFHGVAGTATITSETTIRIDNFTYDGGGPDVHFWLFQCEVDRDNPDYVSISGTIAGMVFNGETVELTVPAPFLATQFDHISVWCVLARANFGSGVFGTAGGGGADLSLTHVVDQPAPAEGAMVTYTLNVTNNGPQNTNCVDVVNLLPAGVTYLSDDGNDFYDPISGVWDIGPLGVGLTATLNIMATVNAGTVGMMIANTAEVAASSQADPNSTPGNNAAGENDQALATITVMGNTPPPPPPPPPPGPPPTVPPAEVPMAELEGMGAADAFGQYYAAARSADDLILADVSISGVTRGTAFEFKYDDNNASGLPGGTLDGFDGARAFPQTFTVEAEALPGGFAALLRVYVDEELLAAAGESVAEYELHALDESSEPPKWVPAGENHGEVLVPGGIGRSGYYKITGRWCFWTVRDRLSTFAVGIPATVVDPAEDDPPMDDPDDAPPMNDEPDTNEPAGQPAPMDADGDGVDDAVDECPDTAADVTVDANGCPLEEPPGIMPDGGDQCGAGAASCGAMGMVSMLAMMLGVVPMRYRRAPCAK